MNYFYLADGTKTRALDGSGEGLVYRGPFVYRKGSGSSSLTLESAAFGGGRLTPDGALLYVTDYLGSVRAVIDGATGRIYKAVDYSAYGYESEVMVPQQGSIPEHALAAATLPSGMTLRDSFTGQEDQTPDFGTSYTDFGARQYSPAIRRWMTPDPMSEKYYGMSPYVFCNNNPVNFVDPDGEAWETAWDILNVIYDAGAAVYNHVKKDHDRAREHWKNAAYDGLAAVVPGLPAGFSKLRHADEAFEVVNGTIKGTHASRELAKVSSVSSKYSDVASPKNAGAGKRFTQRQKREILEANMEANGGVLKSDGDGRLLSFPSKNVKGQKVDMNQAEVDHINPRSVGGSNHTSNAQVLSKEENLKKSNKW